VNEGLERKEAACFSSRVLRGRPRGQA